ncbi:MAG: type II CRISPR-associated endonuclease Cas1 [Mariprofundaceae bacterium]
MSEQRILHVESPAWIGLDTGRLCIRAQGREEYFTAVEDVAALSLSDPALTISGQALQALAEAGAVVLINDRSHLPAALMLPLQASTLTASRIRRQAEWLLGHADHASATWAEIVAAKLRMQAAALRQRRLNGHLRLCRLAERVEPGDPSNIEAQGARHYWKHLFGGDFRRNKRDAGDHLNHKLNYGYAVLRALVAWHLALAGLAPALGLKHRGPLNAFNLADDLMEPFRPLVDGLVRDHLMDAPALDREAKRTLLGLISMQVTMSDGRTCRMHTAIEGLVQSLCRLMDDPCAKLVLPKAEANGGQ